MRTPPVARLLRNDTVSGLLLIGAALIAIVWANSPWGDAYRDLSAIRLGPAAWHLDLTPAAWASDGLLAVFFFVVGLELKREFVAGELRDPRHAALPVAAAAGGMAMPALIYVAVNLTMDGGAPVGWAIPTATDIAFALAVLGVVSTNLPASLRTFLLTLAVVDDLLAITVIAVFYTSALHPLPLALTLLPIAAFGLLVRRGVRAWWALWPFAVLAWGLMHASGVHATVAGVLLAFTVPVRSGLAERFEHRLRPLSTGLALPVFAFFASGVSLAGGFGASPVLIGVAVGLVAGKTIGITAAAWIVQRWTRARLAEGLSWWDVLGLAMLGGVGFTVALLIGELSFGAGSERHDQAKLGILLGSLISALGAAVILRIRNRTYRVSQRNESVFRG